MYNQHKESTKINYHGIWNNFNKFVIRLDHIPAKWEETTSLYCSYLVSKGCKSATLRSYVSAIKSKLVIDGYRWDDKAIWFNALTRACKMRNDMVIDRQPIRKPLLSCIIAVTQNQYPDRVELFQQKYNRLLFSTAFQFAYFGMLRVGEYACSQHAVKAVDVHIADNYKNKVKLILHTSKTHGREARPQKILIQNKESDKFKNLNPVAAAKQYGVVRGGYDDNNEQYFINSDKTPLTPNEVRATLRVILSNLSLDPLRYDTHSFRVGRATDLMKWGTDLEEIKRCGRWRSNAVYKYLRE